MNKNYKIITALVIIAIIVIVIACIIIVRNNNKTDTVTDTSETQEIEVQTMSDGTKLNTSNKLSEIKRVGNLEISGAQLTNKDNKTTFLADVKNVGTDKITMLDVEVVLLDKTGNTVKTLNGLLGTIASNGTTQLNVETTGNYTEAYDYKVNIK